MAGGTAETALDPTALKAQHAIIYEANTSEIKDDTVALLAVLKTGHGALTRQEAAFLIWYHAMDGYDRQAELVANGVVNVCLGLLDPSASEVAAPEKTCAVGILVGLCSEEEMREAVARGKSACTVLHALLRDQRGTMQLYATRLLRLLAEDAAARSVLLRSMENKLHHAPVYKEVLCDCPNAHVVAQLAHFLVALLEKRDDLRGEAIEQGLVEACLESLQKHKTDTCASAVLKLLLSLLEDRAAWPCVHAQGGLVLLVDLLGPPPKTILDMEMELYRPILDPGWAAAQEAARLEALRQAEEAQKRAEEAAEAAKDPTTPRGNAGSLSLRRPLQLPSRHIKEPAHEEPVSQSVTISTSQQSPFEAGRPTDTAQAMRDAAAAVDKKTLLSLNRAGLKWKSIVSMQTYSLAAGCLYMLCQNTEYLHIISGRMAASRLTPLLLKAMESEAAAGGKKKGKGKGLSLSPEQTQTLVHFTGCLKFLSLINVNRYRIAALNAVKVLALLYSESSHTLLRRNVHVILSNMALLAENGQVLLDGGLPEQFLVPRPLRLGPAEIELLMKEFPNATISGNTTKPATTPPTPSATGAVNATLAAAAGRVV